MRHLENSLRIKATGICNRNCSFCHHEGEMNKIQEIEFSKELENIIDFLNDKLNIKTIALTGGEPLMHHDLTGFTNSIFQNTKIKKFSLTTNGTIKKDKAYWKSLKDYGLYKVNISMSDILDKINKNDIIFDNQKELILTFLDLKIDVKINIVVFNDKLYTGNTLSKLLEFKNGFNLDLVLLPNLLNQETFDYSQEVIRNICQELNLSLSSRKSGLGTSRSEDICTNPNGDSISIKNTKKDGEPFFLKTMCDSCEKEGICQEGFYGIRLEQRNKKYFIRLCIYKNDYPVVMNFEDFIKTDIFEEICSNWCNN